MINLFKVDFASLGFLRLSLFMLAIINTLICFIGPLFLSDASATATDSFWAAIVTLVTPVLSLLLLVVIFFDYVMSKVRASDLQDDSRLRFIAISRIELLLIVIMLAYWIPFFMSLGK